MSAPTAPVADPLNPAGLPAFDQLPLFPERPLALGNMEMVTLDRLPPDALLEGPPPSPALLESIRRWGVLEPILVRAVGGSLQYDNPRTLVSGRRRLKALRRLHEEYAGALRVLTAGVPADTLLTDETVPGYRAAYERLRDAGRVPVRVISDPEGTLQDNRTDALILTTNAVRADNPVVDLRSVMGLFDRFCRSGLSEREAVGEIAKATGLAVPTIKQRLRLLRLGADLLDDFYAGRLPYAVALAASALGPESQALFASMVDGGQAPTLALVKQAKRDAVKQFQADLLDGLPEVAPEGPLPGEETLAERATILVDTLRGTRLPVCAEAADVIEALLEKAHAPDA